MLRFLAVICVALCATWVQAQTFPERISETVNDFGAVLLPSEEVQLHDQLVALQRETGVEMTVITLPSLKEIAPGMKFETYATALFNTWGIGDSRRNDGVMLLQVLDTRSVRLELGDGYGDGWNGAAKRVIERSIIPAFKEGQFGPGMVAGVDDTIQSIIRPHNDGKAPPRNGISAWWITLFALPFAAVFFWPNLSRRLRKCPECGHRGSLETNRTKLRAPLKSAPGEDRVTTRCSNCSYNATRTIPVYYSSHSNDGGSSSSGGGGSSSGGGASGNY